MRSMILAIVLIVTFAGTANAAAVGVHTHRHTLPPGATIGGHAAVLAVNLRGRPYVWGGTGPDGFDCSGFTRFVYAELGIHLPHSSYAQWNRGRRVPRSQLRPGDLVFFDGLGHVGIYLGHNLFIHAPHTGTRVSIASLRHGWYAATYDGAVRIGGSQHRFRRPGHHRRWTGPDRHFALLLRELA